MVLDDDARAEMRESASYYEAARVRLGHAFLDAIERTFDRISESPLRWPRIKGRYRRCLVPGFPFGVIYALDDEVVYIAAIAHLKRKPGYWLGRGREEYLAHRAKRSRKGALRKILDRVPNRRPVEGDE